MTMNKFLLTAFLALAGTAACTNPEVPAGHEGYVFYTPLVFGKMEFRDDLAGPASTGVSWRLSTINIDMRAKSYKEDFKLLTSENLSVEFEVNTRIRLRPGTVKEVVEDWGGSDWYKWNVEERLRTIVREEVTAFSALAIQLETPKVRARIEDELRSSIETDPATGKPTPILIESVDIGEIHFPEEVAKAIERKIATKQELERQRFVLAKTKKEAAIKVLEAIRVAKQQLIISSTLDPLYVQQRAIQAYRKVAKSENQVTIVLPNSGEGTALPKVLEPKTRRVLTEADKERIDKELNALEETYRSTVHAEALSLDEDESVETPAGVKALEDAAPEGAEGATEGAEGATQGTTDGATPPAKAPAAAPAKGGAGKAPAKPAADKAPTATAPAN